MRYNKLLLTLHKKIQRTHRDSLSRQGYHLHCWIKCHLHHRSTSLRIMDRIECIDIDCYAMVMCILDHPVCEFAFGTDKTDAPTVRQVLRVSTKIIRKIIEYTCHRRRLILLIVAKVGGQRRELRDYPSDRWTASSTFSPISWRFMMQPIRFDFHIPQSWPPALEYFAKCRNTLMRKHRMKPWTCIELANFFIE